MSNSMKLLYDPNNNMDKYEGVNSTKIKEAKGRNNQNKMDKSNKVKKQVDKVEFSKDLSVGDSGKSVVELQNSLDKIGVYKDSIDGYYGKSTESAVKKFQKSKNMNENGIANNKVKYELAKGIGSIKSIYKRSVSRTLLNTAYDEPVRRGNKECSVLGCEWDEYWNKYEDDMDKLNDYFEKWDKDMAESSKYMHKSVREAAAAMNDLASEFKDMNSILDGLNSSMDQTNSSIDGMNLALDKMNSALDGMNSGVNVMKSGLDKMNSAIGEMNSGVSGMNSGLSSLNSALDEVNAGIKEMIKGVRGMNSGVDKMIEGIGEINTGVDVINKVGDKVKKEIGGMIAVINGAISSVNGMVKGINKMNEGLKESNDAVNGMNSGVQKICNATDGLEREAIRGVSNLFKVATLQHSSSSSGTSNTNSYGNVSGSKVEEHYDVGLEEETGKEIVLAETNNIKVTLEKSISAGMPGKWVNASVTGREISVRGLVENTLLDNIKGLFGASAIDVSIGSISMSSEGVELNSSIDIYSEKEIKGITSTIKDSFKITGKITKDDINNIGKGAALVAGTALVIGAVSTEVGSLGISTPESIPAFIWGTKLLSRAI